MSQLTDNYFPFDTGPGSSATPDRWRLMARNFSPSGVIPGYMNQMNPTLSGTTVTVDTGGCWVDGFFGQITAAKTLTASGDGMVVARVDPTARQVSVVFVLSQTVPTQTLTGIYEIPLMQITGATGHLVGRDIRQFGSRTQTARCRVWRSSAYSTTTAWTAYGWDQTSYGTGFVGNTYTCPYTADYHVYAQIGFYMTADGQYCNIQLNHTPVGGTAVAAAWSNCQAPWPVGIVLARLSDIVPCNAGDTLMLWHQYSANGLSGFVGNSAYAYMVVRALPTYWQ